MANILLVDDNEEMLKMMSLVLRNANHHLYEATNGKKALQITASTRLDLVITDLLMPDMDGLELMMTLHKKSPGLRVLAISGGGRVEAQNYLALADKLGAVQTLSKPFSANELVHSVNQLLTS